MILNLLWVLCHGLVAVKLIRHFLNTFPSCASIGRCCATFFFFVTFSPLVECNVLFVYLKKEKRLIKIGIARLGQIKEFWWGMDSFI